MAQHRIRALFRLFGLRGIKDRLSALHNTDSFIAVFVGLIVATITTEVYIAVTPGARFWQYVVCFLPVFGTVTYITHLSLKRSRKRMPNAMQEDIQRYERFDHMPHRGRRSLHTVNPQDQMIFYRRGAPPMTYVREIGLPFIVLLVSIWGFTNFAGIRSLIDALQHARVWYVGAFAMLAVLTLFGYWAWISYRAVPLRPGNRRDTVFVLILLTCYWGILMFPLGSQIIDFVRSAPRHAWLFVMLPAICWTAWRYASVLGSFIYATDKSLTVGRIGYWIQDDTSNTVKIKNINDITVSRPTMLHSVTNTDQLYVDAPGEEKEIFQAIDVKNGEELKLVLDSINNQLDPQTGRPSMPDPWPDVS